jgi:hypothetical protein
MMAANLTLAFLLELAMLAAFGYWGCLTGKIGVATDRLAWLSLPQAEHLLRVAGCAALFEDDARSPGIGLGQV